jgi:hypothetical protein
MNTQKGFATPELSNEELLSNLETCALCGEKLRFTHRTDYLTLEVHEEAKCLTCGAYKSPSQFILQ